jgi:hypothetical protein
MLSGSSALNIPNDAANAGYDAMTRQNNEKMCKPNCIDFIEANLQSAYLKMQLTGNQYFCGESSKNFYF